MPYTPYFQDITFKIRITPIVPTTNVQEPTAVDRPQKYRAEICGVGWIEIGVEGPLDFIII